MPTGVGRRAPLEAKKARTRQRLVDAARELFNSTGFYDVNLSDIPPAGGLATGTFYNYFTSKEEIFGAVMDEVLAEMRNQPSIDWRGHPVDSIRASNRAYLTGYRRNARLLADCSSLARVDSTIRARKAQIDDDFEQRLVRAIRYWQESQIAAADIDARYAANALAFMVDRFAYEFYVGGKDYDEDTAVDVLTALWVRSLSITADT